jgi:hypothetical protein
MQHDKEARLGCLGTLFLEQNTILEVAMDGKNPEASSRPFSFLLTI